MKKSLFAKKIIAWYEENKRPLPWRETKDPYKIWLSEVILQQTRVAQGLQYYHRFVDRFPTVDSLASAGEQDVLRLWQGLGYYTRARNLHKGAKKVIHEFHGEFPSSFSELQKIPGIGSYTAAAIASISFGERVAVVDGNVFRVLARVFGVDDDILSGKGKTVFFKLANELIPLEQPDTFNQAIMEFGALHCVPKNPACEVCVFKKQCVAYDRDLQSVLPVKSKKQKSRKRFFYYFVFIKGKKILMRERGEKDIWHGLHDFYLTELEKPHKKTENLLEKSGLPESLKKIITPGHLSTVYKHVLSHQTLYVTFIELPWDTKIGAAASLTAKGYKFYPRQKISELPKPVLITRFLKDKGYLK
jgi:A/G-specific adenine glycosylase